MKNSSEFRQIQFSDHTGKVVWDLNGRTRGRWDRRGKYEALGEPYWDGARGAARPMPVPGPK